MSFAILLQSDAASYPEPVECDTSVIGGIHLLLFILSGCNFNCKNRFYPQGKISHTNTKYQFHGQICEILFA